MTREQIATDIKLKLVDLNRDQLVDFLNQMDDTDASDLLEEAVELINDIFSSDNQVEGLDGVHSDICNIINVVTSEAPDHE